MAAPAIGVFDSGVGGLTVLRALQERLPLEPTVYLGDTARVPYGTRSAATVVRYALNNARTLCKRADIKLLVIACNTATAAALTALQAEFSIPVIGVIEPGARAALAANRGGAIAVLGTAGTVRSRAYAHALTRLGFPGAVHMRACPLLVPLVEEGWTTGEVPRLVAQRYLQDLPEETDTVVLGCTHYPLLRSVLRDLLPAATRLVDGSGALAAEVEDVLRERGNASSSFAPAHRLLVTDAPEQMVAVAPLFLGHAVRADAVELVDVEMTA